MATAGNAPGFENYMNGQVGYVFDELPESGTSLSASTGSILKRQKDDSLKLLFNKGLSILNYTGTVRLTDSVTRRSRSERQRADKH